MRRRDLLKLAALSAGAAALDGAAAALPSAASTSIPVIDTHIHLFDTLRPGGVPWPLKTDTALYKPALPPRYAKLSAPEGVVGAIAIECSPLPSDNQWLLNVVAAHPVMVGMVGDLVPGSPTYEKDLERLHADPHFLGIRYGNLWQRNGATDDLAADIDKPGFLDGLKSLAAAGLVLDSANPDPRLIGGLLRVSQQVPDLRIVIDHLPNCTVPTEPAARAQYQANLRALAQNPNVFIKLSEIPVVQNGRLETNPRFYEPKLDAIWDVFGEDHILFGSDWPNSDHVAPYAQTFAIVRAYIGRKSAEAQQKFFWKNSTAAYRWQPRRPDQHLL